MAPNASKTSAVLVTGGSGFIALELISQLLAKGYAVHATVRSVGNIAKVSCLQDLKTQHPEGKLLLFEADLLQTGSFHSAMQGCDTVFHVASPFKVPEKIKDGYSDMVQPALQGTRNVLKAVEDTPSVQRVVFTSTTGAIAGDYKDVIDKMRVMSHDYFNETSTVKHNPYHYSKVLAEKEAWKISEEQQHSGQRRWDLVVICPAFVLGPTLRHSSESGSLFLMDELLSGLMFYGVPDLSFLPVDVRDVATAHIRAAELKEAYGRYIVGPPKTTTFLEISKHFKKLRSGTPWVPSFQLPTPLVRIVGPLFGLSQKWMSGNLGVRFAVDNTRSISELGLDYRSLEETLNDHYESWEKNNRNCKTTTN
ncbi:NAD dependent epimerase/dehydratase [Diaporthe helianthi]|uniref:NAD dependent epimerase/dehydratase n=1 Tax=Diaporthe helianthi TaxID=158607 RepID=A0A2P5HHE5_DIAHE|nr:NAD dependent epimerase/dehydratase [Diaporthe helianthi]